MQKIRSFKLGRHGHIEGFQTSTCLEGYLGRLNPACDVWAFLMAIAVRCRELEHEDSWYHYHTHRRIHSAYFTWKNNGKILFYQRNMQKIKVFQVKKTLPYRGISELCMSWRISRTLISSMWCMSISYGNYSPMRRTGTGRFMVPLPHTPTDPFCSFHMKKWWSDFVLSWSPCFKINNV